MSGMCDGTCIDGRRLSQVMGRERNGLTDFKRPSLATLCHSSNVIEDDDHEFEALSTSQPCLRLLNLAYM